LIYLSIQKRQGTEALRSDTRQAAMNNDQSNIWKFIDHPELGRSHSGKEAATCEEKTRLLFWIIASMRVREYEWMQFRSGFLAEATWLSYRGVIFFVLGAQRARALWSLTAQYFNVEFVAMVSDMIKEVPVIDYWDGVELVT
jgi:hypothetical protein